MLLPARAPLIDLGLSLGEGALVQSTHTSLFPLWPVCGVQVIWKVEIRSATKLCERLRCIPFLASLDRVNVLWRGGTFHLLANSSGRRRVHLPRACDNRSQYGERRKEVQRLHTTFVLLFEQRKERVGNEGKSKEEKEGSQEALGRLEFYKEATINCCKTEKQKAQNTQKPGRCAWHAARGARMSLEIVSRLCRFLTQLFMTGFNLRGPFLTLLALLGTGCVSCLSPVAPAQHAAASAGLVWNRQFQDNCRQ